jgi:hypothetical protein
MRTTQNGTAVHACLEMVESIEEAAQTEENFPAWLLDVLEMKADTTGRLTLVYTVGGPHVELRLGDGSPKVIAAEPVTRLNPTPRSHRPGSTSFRGHCEGRLCTSYAPLI